MPPVPRQGDLWWAEFGSDDRRPVIIVSRDELNHGNIILIIPCTASRVEERAVYPNHVLLRAGVAGLSKASVAQTHLIQPVEQFMLHEWIGRLSDEQLGEVLLALAWVVDLFDHPKAH